MQASVVVPTYQRAGYLPDLVAALEAQTLGPEHFEVVIVDNGSLDATIEVLGQLAAGSPLALRALRIEANHGPAAARNLGWRAAAAPVVAFLDDDCLPEPGWLEAGLGAITSDSRLGIVQGTTLRPDDAVLTTWSLVREVTGPTALFEGCNIFYRREALEVTHGFDEAIGWWGEDTALGWSVLEQGWDRGFAAGAVVRHEVVDRGVGWHIKHGYLEGNLVALAARYPGMRREGFWRPWAYRPENAAFALALAGAVAALRSRPALLLALPWLRLRRPPRLRPRYLRLMGERLAVDAARLAGMSLSSLRHRRLML